jgi:hypothetical protein
MLLAQRCIQKSHPSCDAPVQCQTTVSMFNPLAVPTGHSSAALAPFPEASCSKHGAQLDDVMHFCFVNEQDGKSEHDAYTKAVFISTGVAMHSGEDSAASIVVSTLLYTFSKHALHKRSLSGRCEISNYTGLNVAVARVRKGCTRHQVSQLGLPAHAILDAQLRRLRRALACWQSATGVRATGSGVRATGRGSVSAPAVWVDEADVLLKLAPEYREPWRLLARVGVECHAKLLERAVQHVVWGHIRPALWSIVQGKDKLHLETAGLEHTPHVMSELGSAVEACAAPDVLHACAEGGAAVSGRVGGCSRGCGGVGGDCRLTSTSMVCSERRKRQGQEKEAQPHPHHSCLSANVHAANQMPPSARR